MHKAREDREWAEAVDDEASTMDVYYAVHLRIEGVRMLKVEPISPWKSRFYFRTPPDKVVRSWLSGDSGVKDVIECYRHLMQDTRFLQRQAFPPAPGNGKHPQIDGEERQNV